MPAADQLIQDITNGSTAAKPRIGLDTNCVQYYLANDRPWADCLDPIFQAGLSGQVDLYVSTVVVSELLAHAHFDARNQVGYDPELHLLSILNRHFQILDVDESIAKAAGRLRGSYVPGNKLALKTPDALIGATSLANGHTLFVTNDAQLANALPSTSCVYLRDLALDWLAQSFPLPCMDGAQQVTPSRNGRGFPAGVTAATLELGSVQPDPSATWRRILWDAQMVACAINEPCAFFVLTERIGRRTETREVLFWHSSLHESRPPSKIRKRLQEHIGYSARTGLAHNINSRIHGFVFTSLARERSLQSQPCFASKSDHQKEADAWNGYLGLWRVYRSCLDLPQLTWLLCEDGTSQVLDVVTTVRFVDQAKNVLGWKYER